MTDFGYYDFYNNVNKIDAPFPYQKYDKGLENVKNSYKTSNEEYDSDINYKKSIFEKRLTSWADKIRAKCSNAQEVYNYLSKKYPEQNLSDGIKSAYENDLNAILYGTFDSSKTSDYRFNWTQNEWDNELKEAKALNLSEINSKMKSLLAKNLINIPQDSSFVISINPYNYSVSLKGIENPSLVRLLNSNNNAKELFYYILQNSSQNTNSLLKYSTYHKVYDLTGCKLQDLIQKDGSIYTKDGQNIFDLIKNAIDNDDKIRQEAKFDSYLYIKTNLEDLFSKEFREIEDLNLSIGYSKKYGFFNLNQTYEA